jgi:hypothetical protein
MIDFIDFIDFFYRCQMSSYEIQRRGIPVSLMAKLVLI